MASPSDFILLEHGFEFRGKTYSDDDVLHLSIERISTTVKTSFVNAGNVDSVRLTIELYGGEKIDIKSKSGFAPMVLYFRDRPEERLAIRDAYHALASRTFNKRVALYLNRMDSDGFFEYNSCRFFKDGRVVLNDVEFHVDSANWTKDYYYVFMNKKNPGFLDKVSKGWNGGPHFRLIHDQDVLFSLLDHFFGLRW